MKFDELVRLESRKPSRRHGHEEDDMQKACVRWFNMRYKTRGKDFLLRLHHSPNEGKLPGGAKDGALRKAMGMQPGYPDLELAVGNRYYHGLHIELKTRTGRQSETQRAYQQSDDKYGWKYAVVRSLDEFIYIVEDYIKNI